MSKIYAFKIYYSLFPGEGNFLNLQRGDLILLENETGETVMTSSWCNGTCDRTNKTGDFPCEAVYVIPTLDKPTTEIMASTIL